MGSFGHPMELICCKFKGNTTDKRVGHESSGETCAKEDSQVRPPCSQQGLPQTRCASGAGSPNNCSDSSLRFAEHPRQSVFWKIGSTLQAKEHRTGRIVKHRVLEQSCAPLLCIFKLLLSQAHKMLDLHVPSFIILF